MAGSHIAAVLTRGNTVFAELIWTNEMRGRVLLPNVRQHLGSFADSLRGNPLSRWDFALMAPISYPQLLGEIWCHRYYLRTLCDEARFPGWPVREPVPMLQALLAAWKREESRQPPDMSREEALAALELPGPVSWPLPDEVLRRSYRSVCRKYHPDRNPQPEARDKFLRVQKAYERLQQLRDEAGAAEAEGGSGDGDSVGGPRARVLDLLLRAQCIVYARCTADLRPFRYAGYPLLTPMMSRAMRAPETAQVLRDTARQDSADYSSGLEPLPKGSAQLAVRMMALACQLAWLTVCASPRNALELLRSQGVEALDSILRASLAVLEEPGSASAAAGPTSRPAVLAAYCLRTLAGMAAFSEALPDLEARPGVCLLALRAALLDPAMCPAVVEGALCCIINLSQSAKLQQAMVHSAAVPCVLPHCLRFDPAVGPEDLASLMRGAAAPRDGWGPLEALLGVDASKGGACQGAEEALDRSLAPLYLGQLGFVRHNGPAGAVLQAALAARALSQLGGYLGGPFRTPGNDLTRRVLSTLLTPSIEEELSMIDPRSFLVELNGTREEPHVIWNGAMRAQLAAFLQQQRTLASGALRLPKGDSGAEAPLSGGAYPPDIQKALHFEFEALSHELRIAGVYVRVFKERPEMPVRDVAGFAQGLSNYIADHMLVLAGPACGLDRASLAAHLGVDPSLAEGHVSSSLDGQSHGWLLQCFAALRGLLAQVPKAALFLASPTSLRPFVVALEPALHWGHASTAAAGEGRPPEPPLPTEAMEVVEASLGVLHALTGSAKCVEVLAQDRLALDCMWLAHCPPSPRVQGTALDILAALVLAPSTGQAVLQQGGLMLLLSLVVPGAHQPGGAEPPAAVRAKAAAVLSKLLTQQPVHGGRLRAFLERLMPSGLVDAIAEGPGDAAVQALSTSTESPERIWTRVMCDSLAGEVALQAGRCRTTQQRALRQSPSLLPSSPHLSWGLPDTYRVQYPELQGEILLGGVYVRLFLRDPKFPLRQPKAFLEALLERLTKVRGPWGSAPASLIASLGLMGRSCRAGGDGGREAVGDPCSGGGGAPAGQLGYGRPHDDPGLCGQAAHPAEQQDLTAAASGRGRGAEGGRPAVSGCQQGHRGPRVEQVGRGVGVRIGIGGDSGSQPVRDVGHPSRRDRRVGPKASSPDVREAGSLRGPGRRLATDGPGARGGDGLGRCSDPAGAGDLEKGTSSNQPGTGGGCGAGGSVWPPRAAARGSRGIWRLHSSSSGGLLGCGQRGALGGEGALHRHPAAALPGWRPGAPGPRAARPVRHVALGPGPEARHVPPGRQSRGRGRGRGRPSHGPRGREVRPASPRAGTAADPELERNYSSWTLHSS